MRIEEMTTVRASAAQALRLAREHRRAGEWMAPDLSFTPVSVSPLLTPGDRFRVAFVVGLAFDYTVEAVSDREMILDFQGPWCGRERWSFIADGAETIVRRMYEVSDIGAIPRLAFDTAGRAVIAAHYKLELARFRAAVERDPGVRAEIEPPASTPAVSPEPERTSFPIDEG